MSLLIFVCCTLHNFCLQQDGDYEQFIVQQDNEVNNFHNVLPDDVNAEDKRNHLVAFLSVSD